MFKKGILAIIGTKILFFLKPELKIVAKNIVIFAIFILLTIYIHSEYINWSEISGNNKYIALSFIIKNILILISSILLLFSIKRSKFKNDGFDKFRDKELKTYSEKKLEPKTNLQKNEIDDAYFDKFRGKKKLRTTQEIKLGKK
jgi:predicted membrane protein